MSASLPADSFLRCLSRFSRALWPGSGSTGFIFEILVQNGRDFGKIGADGDFVVARLTHEVTYHGGSVFDTRLGPVDCSNRSIYWDATATFELKDGKIVEEWVNRDELSILAQLEAVTLRANLNSAGQGR